MKRYFIVLVIMLASCNEWGNEYPARINKDGWFIVEHKQWRRDMVNQRRIDSIEAVKIIHN